MSILQINNNESYEVFVALLTTTKLTYNIGTNEERKSLIKKFFDNCNDKSKKTVYEHVEYRIRMDLLGINIDDPHYIIERPFDVLLRKNIMYTSWELDRDLNVLERERVHTSTVKEFNEIKDKIYKDIYSIILNNRTLPGDFDGDVLCVTDLNTISSEDNEDVKEPTKVDIRCRYQHHIGYLLQGLSGDDISFSYDGKSGIVTVYVYDVNSLVNRIRGFDKQMEFKVYYDDKVFDEWNNETGDGWKL